MTSLLKNLRMLSVLMLMLFQKEKEDVNDSLELLRIASRVKEGMPELCLPHRQLLKWSLRKLQQFLVVSLTFHTCTEVVWKIIMRFYRYIWDNYSAFPRWWTLRLYKQPRTALSPALLTPVAYLAQWSGLSTCSVNVFWVNGQINYMH